MSRAGAPGAACRQWAGPAKARLAIFVVTVRRAEDRNAAVQAAGEYVVGRQWQEDMVIVRVRRQRMRGPARRRGGRWRVERRHDLHERLAPRIDDPERGSAR